MGRRSTYSFAMQAVRAAERSARAHEKEQMRITKELARDAARSYLEARIEETKECNQVIEAKVAEIDTLLMNTVGRWIGINWPALIQRVDERDLSAFPELSSGPPPTLNLPDEPSFFARLLPGFQERYEQRCKEAHNAFRAAQDRYRELRERRQSKLHELESQAEQYNQQLEQFRKAYLSADSDAVSGFFDLVFENCDYPDWLNHRWKNAFVAESRLLVVDIDLPTIDEAIPDVEQYRYVKSSDQISEKKRSQKSKQSLYSSFISQAVLRKLYEIFHGDKDEVVEIAVVNAFVESIDKGTGHKIRPCLVTVRTSRENFASLDLAHVDPQMCLKRLSASVSPSPGELAAVRPIIEMNMADPRFIEETDALALLDSRPNLMDLTPSEFENLITNLFQKMGLETKLTQASRDGGVDCVAFDSRPVLGGKVIIQAKRYKNTVGVSAVRDLFGAVHNEGASKGILVTTSGFGTAAYEFANGKPLELTTGSNLLYLLKEHAGVDAKIVMPEDWHDPIQQ